MSVKFTKKYFMYHAISTYTAFSNSRLLTLAKHNLSCVQIHESRFRLPTQNPIPSTRCAQKKATKKTFTNVLFSADFTKKLFLIYKI